MIRRIVAFLPSRRAAAQAEADAQMLVDAIEGALAHSQAVLESRTHTRVHAWGADPVGPVNVRRPNLWHDPCTACLGDPESFLGGPHGQFCDWPCWRWWARNRYLTRLRRERAIARTARLMRLVSPADDPRAPAGREAA